MREFADALRAAGEEIVIVYGERALRGQAGRALLNLAARLNLEHRAAPACSRSPPPRTAAASARSASRPATAPATRRSPRPGLDAAGIAEGLASADLHSVWLHHVDPLRNYPDRALWDRALGTAQTVIAVDSQLTDTIREHADVVFPAEAYPEKEGTITHPDGRLQRLRPAIGHPRGRGGQPGSGVRPLWQVIADVARELGHDPGDARTGAQVSNRLFAAVPFYEGITLEEIGGRGVRWVEREAFESPAWEPAKLDVPAGIAGGERRPPAARHLPAAVGVQGGRHRAGAAVHPRPPGRRAVARRRRRARDRRGRPGRGRQRHPRARAGATARRRSRPAACSWPRASREDNANVLPGGLVEVHRVGPGPTDPSAAPAQVQPAVEGLAEMPPSAPLPIPPREVT